MQFFKTEHKHTNRKEEARFHPTLRIGFPRAFPMRDNIPTINDGPDADEIAEMVMECVRNNCYDDTSAFKVAEITRETNLWDDLSFDGLDMVELIMDVEAKLSQFPPYHSSVSIPEEVCDGIKTVGDLVDAAKKVMGSED